MPCDLGLQPGICIGPLPVRFYGIIIVTAALIGGFIATREARRRGENTERIWDALIWIVIAGIIGARLYHVLSTPAGCAENVPFCGFPWYRNHPIDAIIGITQGGLGIFGAIIGGLIVVVLYVRRYKLSLARYLDIAAPALLIAQAIGRWGNFVNQELYGPPTDLPWGLAIDAPHR
jgi:phosphatidylglycerol:prolipoprotein diacylglycerol transferase